MKDLRRLISRMLNPVYPAVCLACGGAAGEHHPLLLCRECLAAIAPYEHTCPRCGAGMHRPPQPGTACPRCYESQLNFHCAVSVGDYDGPLGKLVRALKFGRRAHLAAPLATELAAVVAALMEPAEIDLVVPVPLHWTRRFGRGYNQSALLGRALARALYLPYATCLRRIRRTPQQTRLSAAQRRTNLLNAFAVKRTARLDGKRVLLIDDVMTTGGTLMECARMLRRGGAAKVSVAVIAR